MCRSLSIGEKDYDEALFITIAIWIMCWILLQQHLFALFRDRIRPKGQIQSSTKTKIRFSRVQNYLPGSRFEVLQGHLHMASK